MSSAADYELQLRRNGTATTRALSPPLLHTLTRSPGCSCGPMPFPALVRAPQEGATLLIFVSVCLSRPFPVGVRAGGCSHGILPVVPAPAAPA